MILAGVNLRWQVCVVAALGLCVLSEAHAAFNGFMPLAYSGQVSYNYGYADNSGSQSETTTLLVGVNASGYVWRPWFATTSMALNVGLSRSDTNTSSSEGTVGTGSFSIGVFPRSRFPFSMSYSRTDSRSQQYQELSQVSGETTFQVTRLTLRQSYRPHAYNQLYNAWYTLTQFDGDTFASDGEVYGLVYQLHVSHQSLGLSAMHSSSKTKGSAIEPATDVVSLSHVYTPSTELGVNNLISYVESDPGGGSATSIDTQAFSSFFWRPEHRAVSVSGGVRLSENKSDGATSSVTRSLNTNLGMGYRISRALNFSAAASVGTSDSETTQSLTTTQTLNLSYSGSHREWRGYSHTWNWGSSVSNSNVKTEAGATTTSTDRQNFSMGIGHNLGKTWSIARATSLSGSFSQSASGSKSSEADTATSTINHGLTLGMNSRGGRGSTYMSARVSDSRSFSERDTVFNDLGISYNTDVSISRLSSMSGNVNFQASRNTVEDGVGGITESSSKNLLGGLSYHHDRPFGVYNLKFAASLQGSRQLDSPVSSTTLRSESVFRYALGLLSTSLSLRASRSAGGSLSKSMNFQATRSF